MKKTIVSLTLALAAVLLTSDTAQARRWAYMAGAPGRVVVAPRAAYRPFYPVIAPVPAAYVAPPVVVGSSVVVGPNVVVGPLGRVRYVAPVRPVVVGPYYGW